MDTESTAQASAPDKKQTKERSTIEFPYSDLASAIEIARCINDKAGVECESSQLAAWMGYSRTSGTFRSRYSAARIFGLTEIPRGGHVKLTAVGREVLNPQKADRAKAKAFLNVPLFRQMYETHKGEPLPPAPAIERTMNGFGVVEKQTERARQTFIKSAQVAHFIDMQTGNFIEPGFPDVSEASHVNLKTPSDAHANVGTTDNVGENRLPKIDPIIQGLINRLPDTGEVWPSSERKLWLGILENSFQLVYKDSSSNGDFDTSS